MKKLVCMFSGWLDIDVKEVYLENPETGEVKTAQQWLKKNGNIDGLILESFNKAQDNADHLEFTELDLTIE